MIAALAVLAPPHYTLRRLARKSTDYNFEFIYVLNGKVISKAEALEYITKKQEHTAHTTYTTESKEDFYEQRVF